MDMQNKAKKLIEMIQTAPVEWKPLGEVLVRTKGTKITAGQMKEMHKDNAPLKIFAGGKTFALVDFDDVPDKDIHREPSIIVKSRGIIEFEYYDKPFSHKNEMWSYHSVNKNIYIKYIYYFLKTQENHFSNIGSKMQMPQIAIPDTDNYKIPIPPIETQQKIVKILDKFTELEATLEAELALRKRQYQYYRDFLLDFDNQIRGGIVDGYKGRLKDVVWKTLGEVSDIKVGKSPETNEIGNYPFINAGTIPSGYIASYNTEPDTITTPSRGQGGIGYVGYQASKFWCGPLCYRVRSNNNLIMTKFLYYVMSKDMSKIIHLANMAGIPALNKKDLVNFLIPIPPLAEQEKIVAILDKFDTLTHSISEGLPYEIALRRKQYEYYREQLLAFPTAA